MTATPSTRSTLRSIGSVLAGLVAIVVLSIATDVVMYSTGVFPPRGQPMSDALWIVPTAYRFVFGVLGCWLAARLAPRRPLLHAMILGGIGAALGVIGFIASQASEQDLGPAWYSLAVAAMPFPCAWLGARLQARGCDRTGRNA